MCRMIGVTLHSHVHYPSIGEAQATLHPLLLPGGRHPSFEAEQ